MTKRLFNVGTGMVATKGLFNLGTGAVATKGLFNLDLIEREPRGFSTSKPEL